MSSPKIAESVALGQVIRQVNIHMVQEPELGAYQVKVQFPWLRESDS